MRSKTIYLTDDQLRMIAVVALGPQGRVGNWGNALQAVGIDSHTADYLVHEGYLEVVPRPAAGGSMPHLQTTDKARRELMIRFID